MSLNRYLKTYKSLYSRKIWPYDETVSLGYNCETSFMIGCEFAKVNSYVYSWVYIFDRQLFLDSLYNTDKILSEETTLLPSGMLRCEKYKISFHFKMPKNDLFKTDGTPNNANVEVAKAELKSRISYLSEKTTMLFKSNKKTLFIIKIKSINPEEDIAYIKKIHKVLNHLYRSGKFTLCCVFEEKHCSSEISKMTSNKIKIATVKYFSEDATAMANNDVDGWHKLFQELFVPEWKIFIKLFVNKIRKTIKLSITYYIM